ncbi:hypothetical protein Peur_034073 [Populus x canadensis]
MSRPIIKTRKTTVFDTSKGETRLHKSKLAQWHYNNQCSTVQNLTTVLNSSESMTVLNRQQCSYVPQMASKLECNHTDQPGKKIPKVEGPRAHCDFPRFEFIKMAQH